MKFSRTVLILIILSLITLNVRLYGIIRQLRLENKRLRLLIDETKSERDTYYRECERYKLQDDVVRLRRLNFLRPVDYRTIDKEELKNILLKKLEEELTGEKRSVGDYEKMLVKFGFLKPDEHIMPYVTALYSEQVQGMYNEETKEMILVKGLQVTGNLQRMFMVHELTHALQDQHFNLSSLPLYDKNDDCSLAALSLVEGDASLAMSFYYRDNLRIKQLFRDLLSYLSIDQSEIYNSPYFIRENLLFPYKWGIKFVTHLYLKGGWDKINQSFKEPPESTEQIIHPEKYGIDKPKDITIKEQIPEGWRELDSGTMGEFNIKVLLSIYLGEYESAKPASGWGGDRWQVFENPGTGELRAEWHTFWDTENDADEFFNALRKLLRKRHIKKAQITKQKDYVKISW